MENDLDKIIISRVMSELGKKGGVSTHDKYGVEHYKKMSLKSQQSKKRKKENEKNQPKSTI